MKPQPGIGWAWAIDCGPRGWQLCNWAEPHKSHLLRCNKPSPEAKPVSVYLVPRAQWLAARKRKRKSARRKNGGQMTLRDEWLAMSPEQRRNYADPKRVCVEPGCAEPAGTPWGPHWCADHDDERMERIEKSLTAMSRRAMEGR